MSRTVRIDAEVYEALQMQAIPFQDTPNSVLRRLLGLAPRESETESDPDVVEATPSARSAKRSTRSTTTRKRKRAPKGSLLPESDYELPILQILSDAAGSARAAEVIDALGHVLDGKLKDLDRETLASGRIRWQSRAQFVRLKLTEKGELVKTSPRGVWEISDEGRKRLRRVGND